MPSYAGTIVACVLLCIFCASASAQTNNAREQRARELYSKGRLHYDLGEYEKAIEEFKQAYEQVPVPGLLYDIAQAYRRKGDCKQALETYKNYQRLEPNAHDPALLQRQIDEMEQCARALEAQAAPSLPGPVPAGAAAPAAPEPTSPIDDSAGRGLRIGGIVTGALGVAMVIGGGVAGSEALAKADQVGTTCQRKPRDPCDLRMFNSLDSDGRDLSAAATTLFVLGGSAIIAGTALYYFGWRAHAQVALAPQPGGAMVSWNGAF